MQKEKTKIKDPTLTGEIVRIINPENGADIFHEKHMFGKTFALKRGESKKVDRAIAESAIYLWGFLKMQKLALDDGGHDTRISETNALPEGYKYPEYDEVQESTLDYDAYQFHILQTLATKLKITGAMLCKKETLYQKLQAKPTFDVLKALKDLKVPANFINKNIIKDEQ